MNVAKGHKNNLTDEEDSAFYKNLILIFSELFFKGTNMGTNMALTCLDLAFT